MQPEKFRTLLQFYPLITSFFPKNFSEKANFRLKSLCRKKNRYFWLVHFL
ncbi:hypothetical protein HMPREF1554_02022 [Porphyromonas gingivalis F0569]|nr:hypothetical protein HMPREF1554_02022 [Porphyromonas gingivalis F0569]